MSVLSTEINPFSDQDASAVSAEAGELPEGQVQEEEEVDVESLLPFKASELGLPRPTTHMAMNLIIWTLPETVQKQLWKDARRAFEKHGKDAEVSVQNGLLYRLPAHYVVQALRQRKKAPGEFAAAHGKCLMCDGEGQGVDDNDQEITCPECKGTGKITLHALAAQLEQQYRIMLTQPGVAAGLKAMKDKEAELEKKGEAMKAPLPNPKNRREKRAFAAKQRKDK